MIDPRCVPIGLAPAPFAPVIRYDGFLEGFTVKHAELPSLAGATEFPDDLTPCSTPPASTRSSRR